MRYRLYLLYSLLFIYIIISLIQYNYVKSEISKKENYIEKLDSLLSDNTDFKKLDNLKEDHIYVNKLLDTIIKYKHLENHPETYNYITEALKSDSFNDSDSNDNVFKEEDTNGTANDLDKINLNKNTSNNMPVSEGSDNNPVSKTDKTENTLSIEEQRQKIKEERAFFKKITNVSSSYKKFKPISRDDKTFWIIIQSKKANYKNSIQNIISQINVNGSYVVIKDVKEQLVSKNKNGYLTNYYIKVKLIGQNLGPRNRLTIYADQEYIKWFMAI